MGFFVLAWLAQQGRARARFDVAAIEARSRLENRLRDCEDLLRGVRGFAQASGGVSRLSFRTYLQPMDLGKRYPGLLGVAYGIPLLPAGSEAVERRLRAEHGRPDLRIHPGVGFGDDAIVLFEEPEEPNLRALGFNSSSLEAQRASLVGARDSGELRASPPMALAQAPEAGPGLVLRLAVYEATSLTATIEERRRAFIGYANAVFLLQQLAADSLSRVAADGMHLRLADLGDPERPQVFLEGGRDSPRRWWQRFGPKGLSRREELGIGGRQWELRFEAGRTFFQAGEIGLPWFVLLAGLQTTLLVAALVRSINLTGQRARQLANKMTEELHRSESRLRAIARVMPDAIMVLDAEGRYVEVLTADTTRLVAPPEVMTGRKVEEFLSPELAKSVLEIIRRAMEERQMQSLEYSLETPKGRLRFDARVAPMDVEIDGRPCVIWVARDVTERKAQEAILRQTQKLESLGVLAGGIAHDFNNLLTAIQGHLSLGRLVVEDGEDPTHHFNRMDASIQRAADLARQLLAYAGRGDFRVEPLALNALVTEMTELLGVSRSKKVELEITLSEGLPLIHGDRTQLQQVVMNLVTNASEAIGDRTGHVVMATGTCQIGAAMLKSRFSGQRLEGGNYVTLAVTDDGSGMAPEVLGRIFEPFFTTKPTGRGLGLSAMLGILKAHKAGIEIHSELGQGTCITLFFPATLADGSPLSSA
jgi:PAS domain S-box-containing protein